MVLWLVKLPLLYCTVGLARPALPVLVGTSLVNPGAVQMDWTTALYGTGSGLGPCLLLVSTTPRLGAQDH